MENNLGIKLQEIRKQNKLSQEALAEKLGVSRQAISKWERGESLPDIYMLKIIADMFGITLNDLISEDIRKKLDILAEANIHDISSEELLRRKRKW